MNPDLPQNWTEVPFGELNQFTSKTVDPAEFPQETFELYSVPSFPTGKPEILAGASIGSTKQSVEPNDVLVCKINPRINRVWQVGPVQQHRQIASSEWIGFRCDPLDSTFFRHFFSSPDFRELICTDVTGVGGSLTRAQPKKVATFPVPVAPLSEQIRIADKLDAALTRVDACRDRLERIPAILKRFRQSVLAAATSGALTEDWQSTLASTGSNTLAASDCKEWHDVVVSEIADVIDPHPSHRTPPEVTNGIPYVSIGDMTSTGWVSFEKARRVSPDLLVEHRQRYTVKDGDFIFGKIGTIGRPTFVPPGLEYVISANVLLIQAKSNRVIGRFLKILFDSPDFMALINAGSAATSQSAFGIKKMRDVRVSIPALDEQAEIVRRVETLFAFADRLEARYTAVHAQVEKLTPSLLAKAFRGELVPQDPNDEPASALLERIASKRVAIEIQPRRRQSTAGRKPTRAHKENAAMTKSRQDEDVQGKPYLAQHLRLLGGSVSAEALFKVSELPVADFYKQLAWEVAQGHVRDGKTVLELADAA